MTVTALRPDDDPGDTAAGSVRRVAHDLDDARRGDGDRDRRVAAVLRDVVDERRGELGALVDRFALDVDDAALFVTLVAASSPGGLASLPLDSAGALAARELLDATTGVSPHTDRSFRLRHGGPLIAHGLLAASVSSTGEPCVSLAAHVAAHLAGADATHASLFGLVWWPRPIASTLTSEVAPLLTRGGPPIALRGARLTGVAESVAAAAARIGLGIVAIDLERLDDNDSWPHLLRAAASTATLGDAVLYVAPLTDELVDLAPGYLRTLQGTVCPTVFAGPTTPRPTHLAPGSVVLDVEPLDAETRQAAWAAALTEVGASPTVAEAMHAFNFTPTQLWGAAATARRLADADGTMLDGAVLQRAGRMMLDIPPGRLVRRTISRARFDDLVVPDAVGALLRSIPRRVRHSRQVLDAWGLGGARSSTRRGVSVLFTGDPGTGKTLAAEAIATELGLDLLTVNLATVADKYVGETEKRLEEIFDVVESTSAVMLFDEADSLFGKRTEVKQASDRFANSQSSYLLQRLERFTGIAVLTSNLQSSIDEAFTRRLDVIVHFRKPDGAERLELWRRHLAGGIECDPSLDLEFFAAALEIPGGEIRNITVTAAIEAADAGRPLANDILTRACVQELRKVGRIPEPGRFGPYERFAG